MKVLLQRLLGKHQASSIWGIVLAFLTNYVGGEQNLVSDPKVLLVSAIVFFIFRFQGEKPPAQGPLVTVGGQVGTFEPQAGQVVAPSAILQRQLEEANRRARMAEQDAATLRAHINRNDQRQQEVVNERDQTIVDARQRPDADALRRDL